MKTAFRVLSLLFVSSLVIVACSKESPVPKQEEAQSDPQAQMQSPPPKQDISIEALAAIDPEIQKFDNAVSTAKAAFEKDAGAKSKKTLVDAYVAFGDYMTYESPVSPRQGKYRRALLEYRQALKLDPQNKKAQSEIKQIEDIYQSMGRPVPNDEV